MIGKIVRFVSTAAVLGLVTAACSSSGASTKIAKTVSIAPSNGCKAASQNTSVGALAGFKVCEVVGATTAANHPDNIVVSGNNLWVGWQNITAKDGGDDKSSTISEYTTDGNLVKSWSLGGHTDGMRMDPSSHLMWVMCNEDGKPRLYTIDPAGTTAKEWTLPATPHGGGFDDIQFIHGLALIDASNPTLDKDGHNVFPALYKVALSGTAATLTPLLMGNGMATSLVPPVAPVTLNLTDPDSMMIDPQGDLVLEAQADGMMLFIKNVGTPQQSVSTLSVGTAFDDSVWPTTSRGCIVLADGASGVYTICSSVWVPGTQYVAAPNDSTISSFLGTVNPSNGFITPVLVGINNPHGMAFIPQ